VINSIGLDPVPDSVGSYDIQALADQFDQRWADMSRGVLADY